MSELNQGDPVPDPTSNVLSLVEAAVKRLDDLRIETNRRVDEISRLRAEHARELSNAEAKRLDAIRAVDVGAVVVASERAAAQAAVLAKQVQESAETLRTLVATTATAVAQQLSQLSMQLTDRLALLEQSKYESKGAKGISSQVLMLIAALAGGVIVYLIQQALKG